MWSAGCLLGYGTDLDGVRHGKIHAVQPYVFGRGTIQFREKECQLLCGPFRYCHKAFSDGGLLVDKIFLIQQKNLLFLRKPGQTHGELLRVFDGQNDAPGAVFLLFSLEDSRFGQGREVFAVDDEPRAVRAVELGLHIACAFLHTLRHTADGFPHNGEQATECFLKVQFYFFFGGR